MYVRTSTYTYIIGNLNFWISQPFYYENIDDLTYIFSPYFLVMACVPQIRSRQRTPPGQKRWKLLEPVKATGPAKELRYKENPSSGRHCAMEQTKMSGKRTHTGYTIPYRPPAIIIIVGYPKHITWTRNHVCENER